YIDAGKLNKDEIYPGIEEKIVWTGNKALKFEVENSRGFSWSEVYMDGIFEVKPYTEYILNFWYYHSGDKSLDGNVWLHLAGKRYIKLPDLDKNGPNQWKQYTFYFKTEKETGKSAVQFWGICKKKGISDKIIFDDIQIFTHGNVWDKDFWEISQDDVHSGLCCLKVKGTPQPLRITSDVVGIDYHKRYKLIAFVKAKEATGENYIKINWKRYANKFDMETIGTTLSNPITGTFDWKKIEIPLIPPETAQFLEVELFSFGKQRTWMVDDFFMDGFGDEEIEFLMSQAGFEKDGYKDVVVRTKEKFTSQPFLEIYKKDNKTPVFKKQMEYWGKYKWGRHYYRVEFSELKKEGEYFLKVIYNNKEQQSPVFPIKHGLYRDLAKNGVKYFYYQRSGCEIPGWHKACHLDDAWVTNFNTSKKYYHVDLTGGWFDAADLNKWLDPQGWYVRSVANVYNKLKDERKDFLKGKLPDIVEEAKWGAEYIKKSYKGNGEFYFCVKIFDWKTPPDEDTDNIPGNDDDRCSNVILPETCATLGLASFALTLKNIGNEEAPVYLQTAIDAFTNQTENPEIVKKLKLAGIQEDNICLTLSAIDLYKVTKDKKYLNFAKEHVKQIAQTCIARKYKISTHKEPEKKRLLYFLEPLEEFVLNLPEEPETALCKKALEIVAYHMVKVSRLSPLGHTQTLTENIEDSSIFLSPGRSTTYILSCASHLAVMSYILGKSELLKIAERDLQYALGRNFQGASCMAGVGWKWTAHFTFLCNCPGHEEGIIPYAVNKGHPIGDKMFRTGMPYAVMPGPYSPSMKEWNLEVYGVTQSFLLNAFTNIVTYLRGGVHLP
ncbi:glycoside hydrolase family 9 protein, partial [bacterium]|nr:glycoside hydrolase family 9 protein [bacterium]